MSAARPAVIRWFEGVAYVSLVLTTVNFLAIYGTMRDAAPDVADGRRGAVIMFLIVTLVLYVPLIYFAARRGSNLARWLLILLLGIHLLSLADLPAITAYGGISSAIALVQLPISAILIGLLLTSEARRWFAGERPPDPNIFS